MNIPIPPSRRRARGGAAAAAVEPAPSRGFRGRGRGRRRPRESSSHHADAVAEAEAAKEPEPITKCVRRLVDCGATSLDEFSPDDLKLLKRRCRSDDADLTAALACIVSVGLARKPSSTPRLAALLLIDMLFTRSELARTIFCTNYLRDLATYTIAPPGSDVARTPAESVLPPPVATARRLREMALSTVARWETEFAAEHPELTLFVETLGTSLGVDLAPQRQERADADAAVFAAEVALRESHAAAAERVTDAAADLDAFISRFQAAVHLAVPTLHSSSTGSGSGTTTTLDDLFARAEADPTAAVPTYGAITASLGLGSTTYRLDVSIPDAIAGVARDIAPALLAEVDREYRVALLTIAPQLDELERGLAPDADDARRRVARWRAAVKGLVTQAEAIGCSLLQPVREEEEETVVVVQEPEQVLAWDEDSDEGEEEDDDWDAVGGLPSDDEDEFEEVTVPLEQPELDADAAEAERRALERELFGTPSPPPSSPTAAAYAYHAAEPVPAALPRLRANAVKPYALATPESIRAAWRRQGASERPRRPR
ncbi:hypothetical protein H9P43_009807 [Blastocladiella emersonii ATCC 22665]|nr:hypothetical protein H9P43_009807 [Blastocladiella emersonii ATCC 22665]